MNKTNTKINVANIGSIELILKISDFINSGIKIDIK